MQRLVNTLLLLIAFVCAHAQTKCVDAANVRSAVERMMADYPHSTLQDIYKSFFQDNFGPGHAVPDSAQAASWLRGELAKVERLDVQLYEPTGYNGNYYRVSLAAVVGGKVLADALLSAFLRSVRAVQPGAEMMITLSSLSSDLTCSNRRRPLPSGSIMSSKIQS